MFHKKIILFNNLLKKSQSLISQRTMKNFGHKREPVPLFTTLWHGFLTFTFIGSVLKWDKFTKFLFGDIENVIVEDKSDVG